MKRFGVCFGLFFMILVLSIGLASAGWFSDIFDGITGRSIDNETCVEDWTCGDWNECAGGNQARECIDSNNCGTENNKSEETRSCGSEVVCDDKDGGKNYFEKNYIGLQIGATDYALFVDKCHSDGYSLQEFYCAENVYDATVRKFETVYCPEGCSDGACIGTQAPGAITEDCVDSDGGDDPLVRGSITLSGSSPSTGTTDTCIILTAPLVGGRFEAYNNVDSCDGINCVLIEKVCDGGDKSYTDYMCESCDDGTCYGNISADVAYGSSATDDADGEVVPAENVSNSDTPAPDNSSSSPGSGSASGSTEVASSSGGGSTGSNNVGDSQTASADGRTIIDSLLGSEVGINKARKIKADVENGNIIGFRGTKVIFSGNLEVVDGRVYANRSDGERIEIKIDPDEVIKTINEVIGLDGIPEIELIEEDGRMIYRFEIRKDAKLFGLFRTTAKIRTKVDAENGKIVAAKRPWWSFLASGV